MPGVRRAYRVDRDRLADMFARNQDVLQRLLRRRGLSADAVADAIQDTFLVAIERLGDIRLGSERGFLVAVALNKARARSPRKDRITLDDDMDRYVGPVEMRGLGAVQLCNMLLSELDSELVEVLVLREIGGLSNAEIARSIRIPVGTVASRLRRAREQAEAVLRRIQSLDTASLRQRRWWEALRPEHRRLVSRDEQ